MSKKETPAEQDRSSKMSTKSKKPLYKRNEYYFCLCGKCLSCLNCDRNGCNWLTNSFCGFPCYFWSFSFLTFLGMAGATAYIIYATYQLDIINKSYYAVCNTNTDCDSSIGLYCSVTSGRCNCPASNTTGRCDCTIGKYWNGTACTLLLNFNETGCVQDYNCDQSKKLSCANGRCTCILPKKWNVYLGLCVYSYRGCYQDATGTGFIQTENNNYRMNNFVETCCDICFSYRYTLAVIQTQSSTNYCFCQNSTTGTNQTGCTNICPGYSNPAGYPCGDITFTNQRAAYSIR